MEEKVFAIKKQLLKYIYEKNIDVYIKIQSLYEYAIKYYIQQNKEYTYFDTNNLTTWQLLNKFIPSNYKEKEKVLETYNLINVRANKGVKHFDTKIFEYDTDLIIKTIHYFNHLTEFLYKNNLKMKNLFIIDENIFYNSTSISSMPNNNTKSSNNIKFEKTNKIIEPIINIGTSEKDNGFKICGISNNICSYEYKSIYAVIFNIMQRNNIMYKDKIVEEFEIENSIKVNYNKVYRYEMTILLLIKNNYGKNGKIILNSNDKYNFEINCAIYHINKLFDIIKSLIKIKCNKIKLIYDKKGINISFDYSGNINIIDTPIEKKDKLIWFSENIIYKIDIKNDKKYMEYLLNVIFNLKTFRNGQYEAICQILNKNTSKIIIMPTGSGKSLIYYFVSLLQPSTTLIVEPTEILIKDQIRNLKKYHNINDCVAYYGNNNESININHNFIYLTPKVLQNKKSILSLIKHNVDFKISNIVLDEIHTISNWSHDFRADYLMMSFNLKNFLDNPKYLGFTATANYRVVKDISTQLNIDFNDIHMPIELNNKEIIYNFLNISNDNEAIDSINKVAKKLENSNEEKMIIFTKNSETSMKIKNEFSNEIKYNIDVFLENDENSYNGFLNGRKSILISQSDIGIGINIPSINNICHYGIPISKSKYVQEIGRAGRLLNTLYSYVIYKDKKSLTSDELKLLNLNTSIDEILNIIKSNNCDLSSSFMQILGHISNYTAMAIKVKNIYKTIESQREKSHILLNFNINKENDRENTEICLFFLVKLGIIYNWYINDLNNDLISYDIEISDNFNLSTIKKNCIDYILIFGNSKEYIYNIEESKNIENIIYELLTWYFDQFLLYHREQLVSMYDFVEYCKNNNVSNKDISEELFKYFSLSSTNIEDDVINYINKIKSKQCINDDVNLKNKKYTTFKKGKYIILFNNIKNNQDYDKTLRMEKYLELNYNVTVDIYVFTYTCIYKNIINTSRYERILNHLEKNDLNDFIDYTVLLYSSIKNISDKLNIINVLKKYENINTIIEKIFNYNEKDIIYYGYISNRICERMKELYE